MLNNTHKYTIVFFHLLLFKEKKDLSPFKRKKGPKSFLKEKKGPKSFLKVYDKYDNGNHYKNPNDDRNLFSFLFSFVLFYHDAAPSFLIKRTLRP